MVWFGREKSKSARRRERDATRDDDETNEAAAAMKLRARRRLVGAAVLLLAAVIVVPMVLDPAPRPVLDNLTIDIPSEKTPFTPRLALPPVPDPGQAPLAPPPDTAPAEPAVAAKSEANEKQSKAPEPAARKETPKKPAESKAVAPPTRFVLQAAALGTDSAAEELSDRLRKAGFSPFTERLETKDGVRFRVRLGPYANRDEAQRAQSRLRALGVNATLVPA